MCTLWLPNEVWTLVFGYLPLLDRLTVRATCKYFRDLVDNSGPLRDWTLEVPLRSRCDVFEDHFWQTLRRWRVTSARLTSPQSWTHITKELPGLTTLIINNRYLNDMQDFRSFTNLERLHLTHLPSPIDFEELSAVLPQHLTHLTMCQQIFDTNAVPTELSPELPFTKLKSLAFHCKFDLHPVNALHLFLSSLPQLQHLSLTTYTETSFEGNIPDLPPLHNCSLASLELLGCDTKKLPIDFMMMLSPLPFLRSLAIFCLHDNKQNSLEEESLKLSSWLSDLPALSSLVLECTQMGGFVESIPPSVTHFILMPPYITSENLTALSAQLRNLRHLHLEPFRVPLGSNTALIPWLFPGLRTLRLSRVHVPEDAFLSLASLKELEVLEMLDAGLPPAALVSSLRSLTNNRVRICKSPGKLWLQYCTCYASNVRVHRQLGENIHLVQIPPFFQFEGSQNV